MASRLLLTGIEKSQGFLSRIKESDLAKKPETKFKERVQKDLDSLRFCAHFKIQQVTLRGIPDFLICLNSRFIAIELKKDEREKPNKLQEWTLHKISHAGGITFVVHPGNWYETFDTLKHLSESGDEISINTFH
jgi:hypothetical protein